MQNKATEELTYTRKIQNPLMLMTAVNKSFKSLEKQTLNTSTSGIFQSTHHNHISNNTFNDKKKIFFGQFTVHPAAQRVEDICVSMIGLIIALVITALLSLVAVAVAVSCWLMAYRRRPKATGPLPHPPEFPNPLFTNPDAVSEPTPDYLS